MDLIQSSEASWLLPLILILVIWDSIWKLIALWHAARRKQVFWFILLAIINSLGVLPIIYLIAYKNTPPKIDS
ncbi:MAG: DUF5652 family protein [Bacteroidota bacterium]